MKHAIAKRILAESGSGVRGIPVPASCACRHRPNHVESSCLTINLH
jgi:hypothetical protein